MWPFKKSSQQNRIAQAEIAVAEARTHRYKSLLAMDSRLASHPMDELTRRALKLLYPGPEDESST